MQTSPARVAAQRAIIHYLLAAAKIRPGERTIDDEFESFERN
jgi:hypothetical protein